MAENGVSIDLVNVSKQYGSAKVIKGMDLSVKAGELLVFLGPSGCGKSTTLRMIAGLEQPTDGDILINRKDALKMPSGKRNIAMVFQDYALYPNMTVYQNLDYALRVHKVAKSVRNKRLAAILEALDLTAYRDRYPGQLSGGQKQRVALGRGMAKKSQIFLLDEPLSNIDVQLREQARDQLLMLHRTNRQTIIYVTHDQQEAMALGDRIAVMNEGKIQMIETPANLYHHPANLFVARFVGTPQINVVEVATVDGGLITADGTKVATMTDLKMPPAMANRKYFLGVRPENVRLSVTPGSTGFPVTVQDVVDYGRYKQVTMTAFNGQQLKAVVDHWDESEKQRYARFEPTEISLFDSKTRENVLNSLSNDVLG